MGKIDYVTAKPIKDKRVRKPDGTLLAKAGERVQRSSFWLRREKDSDVTLAPIGEAEKTKAAAKTKAATEDSKK